MSDAIDYGALAEADAATATATLPPVSVAPEASDAPLPPTPTSAPAAIDYGALAEADATKKSVADALRGSVISVAGVNPGEEAKLRQTADRYGLPEDVLRNASPGLQTHADLMARDYGALLEQNPGVAKYLADPRNAAIAHDDIDNMAAIEKILRDFHEDPFTAWLTGSIGKFEGGLLQTVADYSKELIIPPEGREWFQKPESAPVTDFLTGVADVGAIIGEQADEKLALHRPDNPLLGWLYDLSTIAPAVAAGAVAEAYSAGAATPVITAMFTGLTHAQSRNEMKLPVGETLGRDAATVATFYALGGPVVKLATMPMETLLKTAGLSAATSTLLKAAAAVGVPSVAGGVSLAMITGAQEAWDKARSLGQQKTWGDILIDMAKAIPAGLLLSGLPAMMHVGNTYIEQRIVEKNIAALQAHVAATRAMALPDALRASLVGERTPDAMQTFMQKVRGDNNPNVGIPLEAFNKYAESVKLTPEELAVRLGAKPDALEQARMMGENADVMVPHEKLFTSKEHFEKLLPDTRILDKGMTQIEAREWFKTGQGEAMAELLGNKDSGWQAVHDAVHKSATKGGFSTNEAATTARLEADHFSYWGAAKGVTPMELFESKKRTYTRSVGVDLPNDGRAFAQQAITAREAGQNIGTEAIAKLTQPDHVYRGMTAEEFNATVGAGKGIGSTQAFSTAGEGTSFAHDAASAESYVNFGRDDPRKTGKPTYLVEAKAGADLAKTPDGYSKASAAIPQDRVTRVFEMRHENGAIVAREMVGDRVLKQGPRMIGERVVGAPPGRTSVADRKALVKQMLTLVEHPFSLHEKSLWWYEETGGKIRELTRGNRDLAEKVSRLMALYSQGNLLGSNVTATIKSMIQIAEGKTPAAGRFPEKTIPIVDVLLAAKEVSLDIHGVNDKLLNFYRNLVDPATGENRFPDAVTLDRWMMRRMGYPFVDDLEVGGASNLSATQYLYAEDVIQQVADKYSQKIGKKVLPRNIQAALWTNAKNVATERVMANHKSLYEGSAEWLRANGQPELAKEMQDKADKKVFTPKTLTGAEYFDRATALVTWEVVPSVVSGELPGIHAAPEAQRREYTQAMRAIMLDAEGNDELLQRLGLSALYSEEQSSGTYLGDINPNTITGVTLPGGGDPDVAKANAFASAVGYFYKQGAVPWYRADSTLSGKATGGITITFNKPVTPGFDRAFYDHLRAMVPGVEFTKRGNNGYDILNFQDKKGKPYSGLENAKFSAKIRFAVEKFEAAGYTHDNFDFKAETKYIEAEDYEGHLARASAAGSPGLQAWLDSRQPLRAAVNADFIKRYGWDKPGRGIDAGRTVDVGPRGAGQLRPVGDGGADGRGTGQQPVQGRVDISGVHYSTTPRLVLDGRKFGTGFKGAERGRVRNSTDERVKARVYFYVNEGEGVRPEPEVGSVPHRVDLANLYDYTEDPLNLRGPDATANEIAVLDAGFAGYYVRGRFGGQGVAVLLGEASHAVPATRLTPEEVAAIPQAPPAPAAPHRPLLEALVDLPGLPGGAMTPTEWRTEIETKGPALAEELAGEGAWDTLAALPDKPIYRDQLIRTLFQHGEPGAEPGAEPGDTSWAKLPPEKVLSPETLAETRQAVADNPVAEDQITPEERARAEPMLAPLIEAATRNKSAFDELVKGVADDVGGVAKLTDVKAAGRSAVKLVKDYKFKINRMMDVLRATVVVRTMNEIPAAIAALKARFPIATDITGEPRLQDRFATPTDSGYSDVLANVVMPDGTVAEIQINIPEFMAAKDELHKIYRAARDLPDGPLKTKLVALQARGYGEARSAAISASNLAGEHGVPSLRASDELNLRGSGSNAQQEPSGSNATAVMLQSNSLVPSGNDALSTAKTSADIIRLGAKGRTGQKEPDRGQVAFGKGTVDLTIFETGSEDTIVHELMHTWLEDLREYAQEPDAPQWMKDDWEAAKKFGGFDDLADGELIPEVMHEKIADGGITFFREGKAPSTELQPLFDRFKVWFFTIFKAAADSGVKINPAMREVYGRMLASQEAIDSAQRDAGLADKFFATAKDMGLGDGVFNAYTKLVARAKAVGVKKLEDQALDTVRRETTQKWQDEKDEVRAAVESEVAGTPRFQVVSWLTSDKIPEGSALPKGGEGLSGDILKSIYKNDPETLLALRRLRVISEKDGLDPADVAETFGYNDVGQMVDDLVGNLSEKQWIDQEVKNRMLAKHGDLMADNEKRGLAALDAVHNNVAGDVLAVELKALHAKVNQVNKIRSAHETEDQRAMREARDALAPVKAFRAMAEAAVSKLTPRELEPHTYMRAEQAAGKASFEAVKAKRYAEAYKAKAQQMYNHYLFREASKAKEEMTKLASDAKKWEGESTQATLGKAGGNHQENFNGLLEQFEFKKVSGVKIDRREALRNFVTEQEAQGNTVAVTPALLDARQRNYRTVPIDELRALHDALKNILSLARLKNRLSDGQKAIAFADGRDQLLTSLVAEYTKVTPLPWSPETRSLIATKKGSLASWDASLLKMEQLLQWMDGGKPNGPWQRLLFRPISDGQAKESDLNVEFLGDLQRIMSEFVDDPAGVHLNDQQFEPSVKQTLTNANRIMFALYAASESGHSRIKSGFKVDGRAINDAEVKALLDTLTPREWKLVHDVIKSVSGIYPQAVELKKRSTGLTPPRIEGWLTDTPMGAYLAGKYPAGVEGGRIGGYAPLDYNPEGGPAAQKQMDAEKGGGLFTRASIAKGFLEARVEHVTSPLSLQLQGLGHHIAEVSHYIAYQEAIQQVNKILNDDAIRSAISERVGVAYHRALQSWLKAVANDRVVSSGNATKWQQFLGSTRANMSVAVMGFKATTTLNNFSNFIIANGPVEVDYLRRGFYAFMGGNDAGMVLNNFRTNNPDVESLSHTIMALSGEMRHRPKNLEMNIRDVQRRMLEPAHLKLLGETFGDAVQALQGHAFDTIVMTDRMMSHPTWWGAYLQAMERDGLVGKDAVAAADSAVRLTQGAGGTKDLSEVQVMEAMKNINPFYSYFNVLYSRLRNAGHLVRVGRGQWQKAAWNTFLIFAVAAPLSEWLSGRGPKKDENVAWWAARASLTNIASTVPFAGAAAQALYTNFGVDTPQTAYINALVKAAKTTFEVARGEKPVSKLIDPAADALGMLGYLPGASQAKITGHYLWDLWDGKAHPTGPLNFLHDLVFRREKKP